MSDFTIDLNGVRAVSVRVVFLWRGAWWAEVDLDPDSATVSASDMPTGQATITIAPPGGTPIVLVGTVDPDSGGRFVSSVKVMVLAGGGGWATPVDGQHFQNPNGVSSLTVEQATAAIIGETVNDPIPVSLGTDWVREGSPDAPRPASDIFADRQWYVDTSGVTQVQVWPPATSDASVELLEWDPLQQCGLVSADALILPGTQLTDTRFDGPITVRDVEQTFDHGGTRARIWCSSAAVTRLASALTQMVRTFGKLGGLTRWTYRIVTQNGATLDLQAVPNADGTKPPVPNLNGISVWPGMAGLSAEHALSSNVGVVFLNGDKAQPRVVDFDGTLPQELTLDASSVVHVGPTAPTVAIAGGGPGLARVGDSVLVYFPPVMSISGTVAGAPFVGILNVPGPGVGSIQTGSAKAGSGFSLLEAIFTLFLLALLLLVLGGHS